VLCARLAVAAAASSAYGQYYYGPGFYAGNAYAFEPAPVVPPPILMRPPPHTASSMRRRPLDTSDSRNFGYYGSCAYGAIDTDAEAFGQARPNRRLVR
jgi:hypothetical protein